MLDAAFSVRSVGQTNVCHVLSRGEWAMDVEEHDDSRPARNTTAVQSTSYYIVTDRASEASSVAVPRHVHDLLLMVT